MRRALSDLKLVLSRHCQIILTFTENTKAYEYRWSCGCRATGSDNESLDAVCCKVHHNDTFGGKA